MVVGQMRCSGWLTPASAALSVLLFCQAQASPWLVNFDLVRMGAGYAPLVTGKPGGVLDTHGEVLAAGVGYQVSPSFALAFRTMGYEAFRDPGTDMLDTPHSGSLPLYLYGMYTTVKAPARTAVAYVFAGTYLGSFGFFQTSPYLRVGVGTTATFWVVSASAELSWRNRPALHGNAENVLSLGLMLGMGGWYAP